MKKQINNTYHRVIATYRTFIYCVLAVSLFINYQTMYGKWNTVGLLVPNEPVVSQQDDTKPVILSSDNSASNWVDRIPNHKTNKKK